MKSMSSDCHQRSWRGPLLGLAVLTLCFIGHQLLSPRLGITRSQLIFVLPVVAATCFVTRLQLLSWRVLLGTALALISTAVFIFSPSQLKESVAVATLSDDLTGAHTRSLRIAIIEASDGKVGARTLPNRLNKYEKRVSFLSSAPQTELLVYGSTKWLEVSPQGQLIEIKLPSISGAQSLWISRQLPEFGVNYSPAPQTARFLADLSTALSLEVSDPSRQAILRAIGELVAPWRSQSHRAVPWILLAGDQLERLAQHPPSNSNEIIKAVTEIEFSLGRAAHFAPQRISPRLALTTRHLKATLLTLKALLNKSRKLAKVAVAANRRVKGVLKGKVRSAWRFSMAKATKNNVETMLDL